MGRMTRTIISIPEDEKQWLASYGRRHRVSSAEIVRRAIRAYRQAKSERNLPGVLRRTSGAWSSIKGESQDYIDAIRKDWERRA